MKADAPDSAKRLMALVSPFDTRAYAYPRYEKVKRRNTDLKLDPGKDGYVTVRKRATLQVFKDSLAGKRHLTLGLLSEDGLTSVSCIDIDDYTINKLEIAERVAQCGVPGVPVLSKSDGLHVLFFHDQPITYAEHEAFVRGMARKLRVAHLESKGSEEKNKLEFFPKPPNSDPTKLTKGLNLPYFGSEPQVIAGNKINHGPAIKITGANMEVEDFLDFAEKNRTTAEQRAAVTATTRQQRQKQQEPQPTEPTSPERGCHHAEKELQRRCDRLKTTRSNRSHRLYGYGKDMGRMIAREWITREKVEEDLFNATLNLNYADMSEGERKQSLANGIKEGLRDPHADLMPDNYVSSTNHVARATNMLEATRPNLLHWRDDYMDFVNGAYAVIEDGVINADAWRFLDGAVSMRGKEPKIGPFLPNRDSVGETLAALKAVTHLDPKLSAPCWLDGRDGPLPGDIIAFPNGLLDLRTDQLHLADPAFFTTAALGFDYVPRAEAPEPTHWQQFLKDIYDGDEEEIAAVREMFGYLLTADVSQEKAFFILGPKRSGKGTMLNVMRHLLAPTSVIGPSLKSLGTNFGLQPLIGKQLAIIDDVRVGSKDTEVLVENLLKISGRGFFTIDRKFKTAWNGALPVKLVIVSNLMPKLGDDSAALAHRFIISTTRVSFFGKEDTLLFEQKLKPEIPGIFHWSLDGLHSLRERGRFAETETSKETKQRLAFLGSPVMGFVADRCELHPNKTAPKDELYSEWRLYAEQNGLHPLGKDHFFEALYAATGDRVHGGKKREGGSRVPTCFGITVRQQPGPEQERFI